MAVVHTMFEPLRLYELTNIPSIPSNEVNRDNVVRNLANSLGKNEQKIILTGSDGSGKTNVLSQFARQNPQNCISYFVTRDPQDQRQYRYLYSMCSQISKIIGTPLDTQVDITTLKNLYETLGHKLAEEARKNNMPYFYVIDGLEWACSGSDGERIVDILPASFSLSPYLIGSCTDSKFNTLPDFLQSFPTIKTLDFSLDEARKFLVGTNFNDAELERIHNVHNGHPASLKTIKDAKQLDPDIELDSLLNNIEFALKKPIQDNLSKLSPKCKIALETIAISPTALPLSVLSNLTDTDSNELRYELEQTLLVSFHRDNVSFAHPNASKFIMDDSSEKAQELLQNLFKLIEARHGEQHSLLRILAERLRNYEKLVQLLEPSKIMTTLASSSDISDIISTLRTANQISFEDNNVQDSIRWTLGLTIVHGYIDHIVNADEVEALISIEKSEDALRRAYAVPEPASKIRLLARTYSAMRARNEHIRKEAINELTEMVKLINISMLDSKMIHLLANDLFPILPDAAIDLIDQLDNKQWQTDLNQTDSEARFAERNVETDSSLVESTYQSNNFSRIKTKWLGSVPIPELEQRVKNIQKTKAKDQYIRFWLRDNPDCEFSYKAVELWVDIIVSDQNYVFNLSSLREVTKILHDLEAVHQKHLIDRLENPKLTSLRAPLEEWIQISLNLVEIRFLFDKKKAIDEICNIYINEISDLPELDVKTFCLAKLLSTLHKLGIIDEQIFKTIDNDFHKSFYELCDVSAEQYDILENTLTTIASFDPDAALVMASELNTERRKFKAKLTILREVLQNQGESNQTPRIEDCLAEVPKSLHDQMLAAIVFELKLDDAGLMESNLDSLHKHVQSIANIAMRSITLASLAILYKGCSSNKHASIILESIEAWEQVSQLRIRLVLGYDLVQIIAEHDLEKAQTLFDKNQELQSLPGASLASGTLNSIYSKTLNLIIRSISPKHVNELPEIITSIDRAIAATNSIYAQIRFYSNLASTLYRAQRKSEADEIVRTKILPKLATDISTYSSRLISYSLPIIYEYDSERAIKIIEKYDNIIQNHAWARATIWIITTCFLEDCDILNTGKISVAHERSRILESIDCLKKINQDSSLLAIGRLIVSTIERSYAGKRIDLLQAYDLLTKIDEIGNDKLPDTRNIKHEGFLIALLSMTHGSRAVLPKRQRGGQNRGLGKKEIKTTWDALVQRAKSIDNISDRILVMAFIAQDMARYYDKAPRIVPSNLLNEAYNQIGNIPVALDRFERMDAVAEAWGDLSEKNNAQLILQKTLQESIKSLSALEIDQRIEKTVQIAHNVIGPSFAESLLEKLETENTHRYSVDMGQLSLNVQKLIKNPTKLRESKLRNSETALVLGQSAKRMRSDIIAGKGRGVENSATMVDWLKESSYQGGSSTFDVANWVIESGHSGASAIVNPLNLLPLLELTNLLAHSISGEERNGIPARLDMGFAGLNDKFQTFSSGETGRARQWLQEWLKKHVNGYLKICDPYFGLEQLDYLNFVPHNCKVLIVTTDNELEKSPTSESVKRYWDDNITGRSMPHTTIFVVPKTYENKFHDRVLVTKGHALNVGPSLNGLGTSRQIINILDSDEATELERKYVDDMLNTTEWITNTGEMPLIIQISED